MSNLPTMSLFLLAAGAQGENLLECLTRLDSEWIELDVEGGYKLTSTDTCSIMGPNDCARKGVAQCCHNHCETNNMCDKSGPKDAENIKSCLIKFNKRYWWDPRILSDAVVTPSSCDAVDPNDPRAAFCCPSAARRRLAADEEVAEEESTADDGEAEEGNEVEEEEAKAGPTVVDIEEMCSLYVPGSESTDDVKPEEADKEDGEDSDDTEDDDTEDDSTDEKEEGDDSKETNEDDSEEGNDSEEGVEEEGSEDDENEAVEGDESEEGSEADDKTKEGEPAAGKKPKSGASAFGFTALALVLATA